MKFFKKNQVLIYVIALMLVVAGYLNYSELEHDSKQIIETTADAEEFIQRSQNPAIFLHCLSKHTPHIGTELGVQHGMAACTPLLAGLSHQVSLQSP